MTRFRRFAILCFAAIAVARAATALAVTPASITSPADGSTLAGTTQTFQWNAATGATLYQLWVGSTPGAYDVGYFPMGGTTGTTVDVAGLPTDGRTLYVTLWSSIDGTYYSSAATYMAASSGAAVITSPANGSTLAGSTQTFMWNAAPGAMMYQLWIGTTPGAYDIGYFPTAGTTGTSVTVSGLPTDGRTLYATLWSAIGATYYSTASTYTASGTSAPPVPATITSPTSGSMLSGADVTFQWNAAPGAMLYQLWVGNSPGAYDVGYFPAAGTMGTSTAATGLPTDGRTLYVRLWTAFDSGYQFNDYMFTAASFAPPPSGAITWPAEGSSLVGATETFRWNAVSGAYGYQLWVGSSPGDFDVGFYPDGLTSDTTIDATGLPIDGRQLYVRLWTATMDGYSFTDSTFFADKGTFPGEPGLPMPGLSWTLPGPAVAFDTASAFDKTLTIGNSVGSSEFGSGIKGGLQTWFSNLPIDGRTLYARLTWTSALQPGQTRFRDYPMTAAPVSPAAVMLSPAQNQGLQGVGTSFSFTFSDAGASAYKIWAGTSLGGQEYGEFPSATGTTSTTIAVTVPAGQIPARIRLWSLVGGVWYYRDYQYWQIIG